MRFAPVFVLVAVTMSLSAQAFLPRQASAHPGGLNAQGCHNNRQTGDYHCHRPSNRSASPPPRSNQNGSEERVYYANCSEARAAGAAPIRRGQPGYRPALDRDDDGVACEPPP